MSISSHSKRSLKTSQLMNQIYRRNIAAQLEQIKTNPSLVIVFANDCYEQFEENKIFIDDIYKLLQNNP